MLQAINMLTSSATVGIQNKSSLFNHSQAYQEQIDRFLLRQDDGATNEIPLIDDEDTDVATSADFPEPIIDPVPLPPLEPEIVPLPLPAPEIIEEAEEDSYDDEYDDEYDEDDYGYEYDEDEYDYDYDYYDYYECNPDYEYCGTY